MIMYKNKITLIIFSLLISIVVIEIILRIIDYIPTLSDPEMYIKSSNRLLPYKLKPKYEGYYHGKFIKIDKDGYRIVNSKSKMSVINSRSLSKSILLLGDSLVFGHGLSNQHTPALQLQEYLFVNELYYNVRNIGVPGYTSWNEYYAFKEFLNKYKTDLLILIYISNDISFNNNHLGIGERTYPNVDNNLVHNILQVTYRNIYSSYLIRESIKKIFSYIYKPHNENSTKYGIDQKALEYSMNAVGKIQEISLENNIKFSVGIYRDIYIYKEPEYTYIYENTIKDRLDKLNINSFIIKSHTEKLSLSEARLSWNDPHPSNIAVRYIVEDIYEEITKML